jgi:hypothetical protein
MKTNKIKVLKSASKEETLDVSGKGYIKKAGNNDMTPTMNDKKFKQWSKLLYKRKPGEEKSGYYEHEGEFLSKEEAFKTWLADFK